MNFFKLIPVKNFKNMYFNTHDFSLTVFVLFIQHPANLSYQKILDPPLLQTHRHHRHHHHVHGHHLNHQIKTINSQLHNN